MVAPNDEDRRQVRRPRTPARGHARPARLPPPRPWRVALEVGAFWQALPLARRSSAPHRSPILHREDGAVSLNPSFFKRDLQCGLLPCLHYVNIGPPAPFGMELG